MSYDDPELGPVHPKGLECHDPSVAGNDRQTVWITFQYRRIHKTDLLDGLNEGIQIEPETHAVGTWRFINIFQGNLPGYHVRRFVDCHISPVFCLTCFCALSGPFATASLGPI